MWLRGVCGPTFSYRACQINVCIEKRLVPFSSSYIEGNVMLKLSGLFSPDFLFKFHTATFWTWNVPVPKAHVLKMAPSLGYWEVVGVRLYE